MKKIIAILLLSATSALAQTHTLTGTTIVPATGTFNVTSGATLLGTWNFSGATVSGVSGLAPANATYITQTANGALTNEQALGALATGLLKSTTTTGVLSIAAAGTDYVAPGGALGTPSSGTLTNCTFPTLNQSTTGSAATLTTTRAINGVNFNGSAAIVAPVIGGAGTIVQSNGSAWGASTPTWPTTAGPSSYDVRSNGTNFTSYPENFFNANTADVTGFAADQYLTGSNVVLTAGDWKVGGQYSCWFDLTKTAAGTGTLVITVRMGTLGTTGDTTLAQSVGTFGAGTAAVDSGIFDVRVTFRSVGSGTSAVVQVTTNFYHTAASGAGLFSTPAVGTGVMTFLNATSSGFNSSTPTNIGISINGGTSFAGTVKTVNARLVQP